jgi:hypothetical protein
VWNRKYDGYAPISARYAPRDGSDLADFVSLDFHTRRQLFPLSMRLELDRQIPVVSGRDGQPDLDAVFAGLRGRAVAARAFGLPLTAFSTAPASGALRAAELIRRTIAQVLH